MLIRVLCLENTNRKSPAYRQQLKQNVQIKSLKEYSGAEEGLITEAEKHWQLWRLRSERRSELGGSIVGAKRTRREQIVQA